MTPVSCPEGRTQGPKTSEAIWPHEADVAEEAEGRPGAPSAGSQAGHRKGHANARCLRMAWRTADSVRQVRRKTVVAGFGDCDSLAR